MPKVPPPQRQAQILNTVELDGSTYNVYKVGDDGACFYECYAMWMNGCLVDDGLKALEIRRDLMNHIANEMQNWSPAERRRSRFHDAREMLEDPQWDQSVAFSWPRLLEWHKQPKPYITSFPQRT